MLEESELWVWTMPFGVPVVPEVKTTYAVFDGCTLAQGIVSSDFAKFGLRSSSESRMVV